MIFRRMKSISFIDEVSSPPVAAPAKHTVRIDFIG